MDFDKYYKYMFLIAAIWNIALGLIMFLFYPIAFPLMGIIIPNTPLFVQVASLLIIVFGISYFIVSLNPEDNKGIVQVGAIGKVLVFFLLYWYAANTNPFTIFFNPMFFFLTMNYSLLLIGLVDLIFGLLFIEFIVRY